MTSAQYARDLNEVKAIGSATSRVRTNDQTNFALFRAGTAGTATPPGQWNMIAQTIAEGEGLSMEESARMYAVLNIALADAAITSWHAKYLYDLWRPIDAIRNADLDQNGIQMPAVAIRGVTPEMDEIENKVLEEGRLLTAAPS